MKQFTYNSETKSFSDAKDIKKFAYYGGRTLYDVVFKLKNKQFTTTVTRIECHHKKIELEYNPDRSPEINLSQWKSMIKEELSKINKSLINSDFDKSGSKIAEVIPVRDLEIEVIPLI